MVGSTEYTEQGVRMCMYMCYLALLLGKEEGKGCEVLDEVNGRSLQNIQNKVYACVCICAT